MAKRAKKGKSKIRSWRKMKSKLKEKFLPSHYLQENYSKLHHLKQGSMSVEEYTREFDVPAKGVEDTSLKQQKNEGRWRRTGWAQGHARPCVGGSSRV